jgi:hypothetical protein
MSVELQTDDGAARPWSALETVREPLDRARPNVSGDLPTVFSAAPMFRRALAGYDRFQVDTYVQWAEDELATADRERERLQARSLRTGAELEEARRLLTHSSAGGEFLQVSRRVGDMMAAAADEAESMRADAESLRAEAAAQAEQLVAQAERDLADAAAEAARMLTETAAEVAQLAADAGRTLDEAERTRMEAGAEAEARLEKVRAIEQRAAEHADQLRRQAAADGAAALLQARHEVVRVLGTGREERRRADAAAAAVRERLDRDAVARRAFLLADVEVLEHRRTVLRAELEVLAARTAEPTGGRLALRLHRLVDRLRWRPRFLRTP